jgi:hypothetical protein
MNKTCCDIYNSCCYQILSGTMRTCSCASYCDYQRPRDSRVAQYTYNYTPGTNLSQQLLCMCGGFACSDGVTCSVCGKRKY